MSSDTCKLRAATSSSSDGSEIQCPGCGLTERSLYQDGLLGCAVCYQTFAAEVEHALEEIHGAVQHIGKA